MLREGARGEGGGERGRVVRLVAGDGLYEAAGEGGEHVAVLPEGPGEVAGFLIRGEDPRLVAACVRRLGLAGAVLGDLDRAKSHALQHREQLDLLTAAVRTLGAATGPTRFVAAAHALCGQLADTLGAGRVAVGVRSGRYVKLRAMSGVEKFDRKQRAVQLVEAAMEECLDQDIEVQHPAPEGADYVHRAAGELIREAGGGDASGGVAVCLLPMRREVRGEGRVEGVLLIEREAGRPLTLEEVQAVRLALDLASPRLLELRERDRWLGARLAGSTRATLSRAVGYEHTWVKALALAVLVAGVAVCVVPGTQRVEAPFVVEPVVQRTVPAPFDGRLEQVGEGIEPGAEVSKGEVLAALETRELDEREAKLIAGRDASAAEARKAAGAASRGEVEAKVDQAIAEARVREAEADLRELHGQLERAVVRSPLTGVVLTGDLRERLGGPVSRGETLFEVAPLEALRATLYVDDKAVSLLEPGQRGHLATAAHPTRYLPFTVQSIAPAAEMVGGRNAFRVRVELDNTPAGGPPWPRSGAEGLAKVDVARRPLIVVWTRDAVNWVRMKLWI